MLSRSPVAANDSQGETRGAVLEREDLAPEWRRAFEWVEATTGGRLVRAERQARWRPA